MEEGTCAEIKEGSSDSFLPETCSPAKTCSIISPVLHIWCTHYMYHTAYQAHSHCLIRVQKNRMDSAVPISLVHSSIALEVSGPSTLLSLLRQICSWSVWYRTGRTWLHWGCRVSHSTFRLVHLRPIFTTGTNVKLQL